MMDDLTAWQNTLQSDDVDERAAAAEKLCQSGSDAAGAAVELVKAVGDEDSVSEWAVAALEEIGVPPSATVEPLTHLLSQTQPLVAYWAATLLGRLGPAAESGESELASLLSSSGDQAVKERAAWALGKIGASSDIALEALRLASQSTDARLARVAQTALTPSRS